MPAFRALYYPSWNPPVQWFRSSLLFFDQIQVILPKEVLDPAYDVANKAVMELLPHAFGEIRKTHYEMTLDARNMQLLKSTLDYIAERRKLSPNKQLKVIYRGSAVSVPGYTFLHVSKLPRPVIEALMRRELVHEMAERVLGKTHDLTTFRVVEINACNVILALIADHYGRASALRTITDENLGYLNAALNRNPAGRRDATAMHLASAILRIQVPAKIADLTPKQFVSLRKRYDDLREPFQRSVRTLCDDYLLAGIESRRQFEDAVHDATRDFSLGVDRLVKKKWAKKVGTWAPMSLGVISTLCKLARPVTATIGIGLDACLKVYSAVKGSTPETDVRHAQRLLATLRSELMRPVLMRRLVLGG